VLGQQAIVRGMVEIEDVLEVRVILG